MAGDSDITQSEMDARLFGSTPAETPLDMPSASGRAAFRNIFEQLSPDDAGAARVPPKSNLPPAQQAIVDALFDKFIQWTRNTNFTASLPAHSKPMLWSEPVDLSENYTLPAAVNVDYTDVISYTAPQGRWARIDGYGVEVDGAFTYDDSILWRIAVSGLNIPTLYDWGQQRGTIAIPRKTFVIVPQGQTVVFSVRRAVAAGGTNVVTMALKGWTWRLRKNFEGTKASVTAF